MFICLTYMCHTITSYTTLTTLTSMHPIQAIRPSGVILWQIKSLEKVCWPIGGLFSSAVSTPLNLLDCIHVDFRSNLYNSFKDTNSTQAKLHYFIFATSRNLSYLKPNSELALEYLQSTINILLSSLVNWDKILIS